MFLSVVLINLKLAWRDSWLPWWLFEKIFRSLARIDQPALERFEKPAEACIWVKRANGPQMHAADSRYANNNIVNVCKHKRMQTQARSHINILFPSSN